MQTHPFNKLLHDAAKNLKSAGVGVFAVEASAAPKLVGSDDVKAFPTIFTVDAAGKRGSYNGDRSATALEALGRTLLLPTLTESEPATKTLGTETAQAEAVAAVVAAPAASEEVSVEGDGASLTTHQQNSDALSESVAAV